MTLFQGGRLLWLVFGNMKVPHTNFVKANSQAHFFQLNTRRNSVQH